MARQKLQIAEQPLAPVQTSTAGAKLRIQRIAELGETVREIGAAARPMARRAVSQRAQAAGRQAALEGDFTTRRDPTFAAQEYNRAGLNTALSELEIDMRGRVDEIFREAKHNPDELKTRFEAYGNELEGQLGEGLEELVPEFRAMYNRATLPLMRKSADNYERTLMATDSAAAMQVLEARMNDAERFARTEDIDPAAQQALLEEAQQFDRVLVEHGPKEAFSFRGVDYPADPARSGVFDPTDMEKITQDWTERTEQAAVLGGFDRAEDKAAYVSAFEDRERGRKGSPFTLDQVDSLANRMRVEIRKRRARSDAFRKLLEKQIKDAEKVYEAGKTPANILALSKAASAYPDLSAQLDAAKRDSQDAATFAEMQPDQQAAILNRIKNQERGTARTVDLTKRFERIHNETVRLMADDPVTLLARNQVMEISPIRLDDPATFANRREEADTLEAYYGVRHSGFTKSELTGISTILDNNTAQQNAEYMAGIRGSMDDERVSLLAADLMPKNPEFAAALGVSGSSPETAADILRGIDILKEQTGVAPPIVDVMAISDDYFGDAVVGQNRIMLQRAGLALDAARRSKAGEQSKDEFDPDDFEQALNDITGGVFQYRGKKIVAPAPGIDDDDFDDLIDAMVTEDIPGMFAGDTPIDIETFRRTARLQSTGAGRYLVMIGDGFARNAEGEPYELDIRSIIPDLMARTRRGPRMFGAAMATSAEISR